LKKMSVREVERIIRKIATDKVRKKSAGDLDSNLIEYEKQFTETLGTRVQIQTTDFGGKLTIDYFSVEDLEVMLERMKREAAELAPEQEAVDTLAEHTPLEQVREAQEQSHKDVAPQPISAAELPREHQPPQSINQEIEDSVEPEAVHSPSVVTTLQNVFQDQEMKPAEVSESVPQDQPPAESREVRSAAPSQPVESNDDRLIPEPVASPQPEREEKPVPTRYEHHQPFAARYTQPSFQSNQPVRPATEDHTHPQPAQDNTNDMESAQIEVPPADTPPVPPKPPEDESNLYSIRNFNI